MPDTPVTFDDVRVESADGLGLLCTIGRHRVHVGALVPLSGTVVRAAGDRGRLVLPLWFVELHDLRADAVAGDVVTEAQRTKVHEQARLALMRATFAEVLHRAADEIAGVPDERLSAVHDALRGLLAAIEAAD